MIQIIQLLPFFLCGLICVFIYKKIMKNLDRTKSINVNEVFVKHLSLIFYGILSCSLIFYVSHITTKSVSSSIQQKRPVKIVEFEQKELEIKDLNKDVKPEVINKRNTESFDAMDRIRSINAK